MTKDQLTPEEKAASSFFHGFFDTRGWGVRHGRSLSHPTRSHLPSRYGWDGGFGTSWFNDPRRDMVAIVMTHRPTFCSTAGSKHSSAAYTQQSSSAARRCPFRLNSASRPVRLLHMEN